MAVTRDLSSFSTEKRRRFGRFMGLIWIVDMRNKFKGNTRKRSYQCRRVMEYVGSINILWLSFGVGTLCFLGLSWI
ncbi:hypothetical protein HA466_0240180 [Hirschfeldia incana]|nr:hypothetical protein HA466_0240180 [Hirschfeldia incana]